MSCCVWCLGEWKSRFDTRFTAKDLFYIDRQTSVKVDMMTGSKYPLSMFVDGEQGIQVVWFYTTSAKLWDFFPLSVNCTTVPLLVHAVIQSAYHVAAG